MYGELNDDFNMSGLWRMRVQDVQVLEEKEQSGRGLHVRTFRNSAEKLV